MQTAWIWMRRRVTQRLIRIQFVWHSDNVFTNFEWHWSTLKIEADEKFTRQQFICECTELAWHWSEVNCTEKHDRSTFKVSINYWLRFSPNCCQIQLKYWHRYKQWQYEEMGDKELPEQVSCLSDIRTWGYHSFSVGGQPNPAMFKP